MSPPMSHIEFRRTVAQWLYGCGPTAELVMGNSPPSDHMFLRFLAELLSFYPFVIHERASKSIRGHFRMAH